MPLTDPQVRNAKPKDRVYRIADGLGLSFEVRPSGTKFWRYRYRIDGKPNMYTIGQYPSVSLKDARVDLHDARELVSKGTHPTKQKQTDLRKKAAARKNTFESVAEEWIEQNNTHWSDYYKKQVERGMKQDIYPAIGNIPINQILSADLLDILKAVEKRGAETVAVLIRQWCSAVFRYGVSTLRCESDPAAALKGAVRIPRVQHHQPLKKAEIGKFLSKLEEFGGYSTTKIALNLLLLLFPRPGELRQANWAEFDLEENLWRIPAERMKMREEHLIPLSTQAVNLIKELQGLTGNREYLFPNYRRPKSCMTMTTLNRALERMGYAGKFSSHGFRATASTILNEMGYRPDIIERQLAHKERNTSRAAYNRALYLDERRQMLQEWADFVSGDAR